MHGTHDRRPTSAGTIFPQGFYDILMRMAHETGHLPIEITENGASFNTGPDAHGNIRDHARIEFLRSHLQLGGSGDSATACRFAPSTTGRCSTTSSGPRATRSASASCTSTLHANRNVPSRNRADGSRT